MRHARPGWLALGLHAVAAATVASYACAASDCCCPWAICDCLLTIGDD